MGATFGRWAGMPVVNTAARKAAAREARELAAAAKDAELAAVVEALANAEDKPSTPTTTTPAS